MSELLVNYGEELLQEEFNRAPFLVEHQLVNHPLLELSKLLELCKDLPDKQVEYSSGVLSVNQANKIVPDNNLGPEETIQKIAENKSWMVMRNVEHIPEYRELLHEALEPIISRIRGIYRLQGFIFISSPYALTPYHMDPEHNFLLQIRGSKQIHLFNGDDRSIVSEEDLERFYGLTKHWMMPFKEEYQASARAYDIAPGKGLYFPLAAPHWVKVGPDVSISFSVTFRTEWAKRRCVIHQMNRHIRNLGITPSPVGLSSRHDNAKYLLYRLIHGIKCLLPGRKNK